MLMTLSCRTSSGLWAMFLEACVEITTIIILEDHPLFYLACWLFTMTTLYGITVIKRQLISQLWRNNILTHTSHMLFTVYVGFHYAYKLGSKYSV